ncbi:unnamed protein product [Cunninghamella blakesleeana]
MVPPNNGSGFGYAASTIHHHPSPGSEYGGVATTTMMNSPLNRDSRTMSLNSFGPDLGQFSVNLMNDRMSMMGNNYTSPPSLPPMTSPSPHSQKQQGVYQNYTNSRTSIMQNGNEFDLSVRPMSQFSLSLSQVGGGTNSGIGLTTNQLSGFPSDDEILSEIRNILATANLMTVTKKQVREQLGVFFGFDMTPKKEFINTSIEYILQGRL